MAISLEQARAQREAIYQEIAAARDGGALQGNEEWLRSKIEEFDKLDQAIQEAEAGPGLEEGSLTGDANLDIFAELGIDYVGGKIDEVAQAKNVWDNYQGSKDPIWAARKTLFEAESVINNIGEMGDYEAAERGFKAGFMGASTIGADPLTAALVGSITGVLSFGLNATGLGGSGKSKQQKVKDQYKNGLQNNGYISDFDTLKRNFGEIQVGGSQDVTGSTRLIQLADGSYYNFEESESPAKRFDGTDKEIYDPSKLSEEQRKGVFGGKNTVESNLVDFTNSLDFWTSRGSDGLATILYGKDTTDNGTLWMSGAYTNAATSNTKDREWNQENFDEAMANMRKFYADSGIESFADAKARSLNMLEQGIISEDAYARNLEGYRMVFMNDFDYANSFENGPNDRWFKTKENPED